MSSIRVQVLFALCASILTVTSASSRLCYGDISNLHPTGKSKSRGGLAASDRAAAYDKSDLEKHRSCYDRAADKYCIQAAVIAGIASRESRGGRLLVRTGGYGDGGKAWGIMQCDIKHSHLPCKNCPWDSCCHIDMMVGSLLVPFVKQVRSKHPKWTKAQQLQGAVAAYNFGVTNVQSWARLDKGSAHDDYSNDVIARAKYLQRHGWN